MCNYKIPKGGCNCSVSRCHCGKYQLNYRDIKINIGENGLHRLMKIIERYKNKEINAANEKPLNITFGSVVVSIRSGDILLLEEAIFNEIVKIDGDVSYLTNFQQTLPN